MQRSAPTAGHVIIELYRQCIRSAKRIPDLEQRAVYRIVVKNGFRSKKGLIAHSRQAIDAIQDGQEQLERMDYYHSMRVVKEKEEQERRNMANGGGFNSNSGEKKDAFQVKSKAPNEDVSMAFTDSKDGTVRDWIRSILPNLRDEYLLEYANRLEEDGFDSLDMLENELLEEDLSFMKKAHKRAIVRRMTMVDKTIE